MQEKAPRQNIQQALQLNKQSTDRDVFLSNANNEEPYL